MMGLPRRPFQSQAWRERGSGFPPACKSQTAGYIERLSYRVSTMGAKKIAPKLFALRVQKGLRFQSFPRTERMQVLWFKLESGFLPVYRRRTKGRSIKSVLGSEISLGSRTTHQPLVILWNGPSKIFYYTSHLFLKKNLPRIPGEERHRSLRSEVT